MKNLYAILGVESSAAAEDIRRAWRAQVARLHPDRAPGADERLRAVNTAYAILKDPQKRATYDADMARRAAESLLLPARDKAPAKLSHGRRKPPARPSRLRGALGLLREILWPLASAAEVRHGR